MASEEAAAPTERIVLKLVDPSFSSVLEDFAEVWAPVHEDGRLKVFRGDKKACIEQYAGKGGKDKPGTYRAPSLRSWKGQYEYTVPDEPTPALKVSD